MAVNCCVVPSATLGVAGVTSTAVRVAVLPLLEELEELPLLDELLLLELVPEELPLEEP